MSNINLTNAIKFKNDEFYTRYCDVENEISSYLEFDPDIFRGKTIFLPCDDPELSNFTKYFVLNFDKFGLNKVISTCYNAGRRGKKLILDRAVAGISDLEWDYLKGNGDFRSVEVKELGIEADFIITNPPFSLFCDFFEWVIGDGKRFIFIVNTNAILYKGVFGLVKENKIWQGSGVGKRIRSFIVPESYEHKVKIDKDGDRIATDCNCIWLTNVSHGRVAPPLSLMTMNENIRSSPHKKIKGQDYKMYDNFDAIEVPCVGAIPSDYNGVMGVPITFFNKYNPEQFEIVGCSYSHGRPVGWGEDIKMSVSVDGISVYKRVLIKHKK